MSEPRFLAVICGLKSEAAVVRASDASGKIRIAVSGANAARAETVADKLCRDGAAAVLSVGISGGLDPALTPGDLLIGEAVKTRAGDSFSADAGLLALLDGESAGMRRATLFGSDEIIASAEEKARLFHDYAAHAVDMESHAVARAAFALRVPFGAIRAVADPASRALPKAALGAVAPDGGTKTLSVLMASAKAPGEFPALLQLGADSERALKSLRGRLGGLFRRLFLGLDL